MIARGVARAAGVAAVGLGAVLLATAVPGAALTPGGIPTAAPPATPAAAAPVVRRTLVCPGDETQGLDGVTAAPGATPAAVDVAAASAPQGMPGVVPGRPAPVLLDPLPGARPLARSDDLGAAAGASVRGPLAVRVVGQQGQAPTLSGSQRSLVPAGEGRALVAAPCTEPVLDGYLLAGAGDPGAQEYLVLVNPNPTPVTVEVSVLGAKGLVRNAATGALAVPAGRRRVVLLDGLAPGEKTPVVRVTASGGPVGATLRTTWLDGIRPRGGDDAVATTPARATTIAAGSLAGAGELTVRVAATERATRATVVVRRSGGEPVTRRVDLAATAAADVSIPGLAAGAYAVDVTADAPVVAGTALRARGPGGISDVAWSGGQGPLTTPAGLALPPTPAGMSGTVVLTGAGEVVLTVVDAGGTPTTRRVPLAAGRPVALPLEGGSGAWVGPQRASGVRAAVTLSTTAGGDPLLSVLPIVPRPPSTSATVVEAAR